MSKTLNRRIGMVVGGAVVIVVILVLANERRPAPRVAVVQVLRQDLSAAISSNGKVEPVTPYPLRAKFAGFVDRVLAIEGQAVKRGQLILTLDDADVRAQLEQARAQLLGAQDQLRVAETGGRPDEAARLAGDARKAEAERAQLQRDHDTLEKLVAQNAATPQELEQKRLALVRAEANWQQAQKAQAEFIHQNQLAVERAKLQVEHARNQMRALEGQAGSAQAASPVNGTLYSLPAHPHDFVQVGQLLAEVADLRHVRVRAFIDEPELGALEPNQNVEITWDALPNRTWYGRTGTLPKEVVAHGTRTVGEVLCSVNSNLPELLPNTNVNVRIHLRERRKVLVVPRGAVSIEGARYFVFVMEGDRLQKREIKVGISSATLSEVLSGVREGDLVALPGAVQLRDAMRVRAVQSE